MSVVGYERRTQEMTATHAPLSEESRRILAERYGQNPQAHKRRAQEHRRAAEEKRRRAALPRALVLYAAGLMCFAALFGLVWQNALVAQGKRAYRGASDELQRVLKQADDYRLAISRNDNIHTIQQQARDKLGMDYPAEDQIRLVTLPPLAASKEPAPPPVAVTPSYVRLWNLIVGK